MAKEKELDLVEVSPNASPPVCKIMSWSKFKYDLSKKSKGSTRGKSRDLKEMWFSPYIDDGDIEHKLKKVRGFLSKKHPVKLTIRVKGRVQKEVITGQMEKILKKLEGEFETDEQSRKEGRNLSILILPKKSATKKPTTPKKSSV